MRLVLNLITWKWYKSVILIYQLTTAFEWDESAMQYPLLLGVHVSTRSILLKVCTHLTWLRIELSPKNKGNEINVKVYAKKVASWKKKRTEPVYKCPLVSPHLLLIVTTILVCKIFDLPTRPPAVAGCRRPSLVWRADLQGTTSFFCPWCPQRCRVCTRWRHHWCADQISASLNSDRLNIK